MVNLISIQLLITRIRIFSTMFCIFLFYSSLNARGEKLTSITNVENGILPLGYAFSTLSSNRTKFPFFILLLRNGKVKTQQVLCVLFGEFGRRNENDFILPSNKRMGGLELLLR